MLNVGDIVTSTDPRDVGGHQFVVVEPFVPHMSGPAARIRYTTPGRLEGLHVYRLTIVLHVVPQAPTESWVWVWMTSEGPAVGGPYPTSEAAVEALRVEVNGFRETDGEDELSVEEFEDEYETSEDWWIAPIQGAGA